MLIFWFRGMGCQFGYRGIGEAMWEVVEDVGDFGLQRRGRVSVTDVDGDGVMEVVSVQELRMYKLQAPFLLSDVSAEVFEKGVRVSGLAVSAVAELDFDGDERWDLYVARQGLRDLLLRNEGGRYREVGLEAGIPEDLVSMGVTVGDLNNDGFVDIVVVTRAKPDVVLMNNGNSTFTRVDGVIAKKEDEIGNHAMAADLDLDGKIELVVGHGGPRAPDFGRYQLLKNDMNVGAPDKNWLLVRVKNDPSAAATNVHAVVTVIGRGIRMVRRVGGRGAGEGEGSLIDTVHFGLGRRGRVGVVKVRWSSGVVRRLRGVVANQVVEFGV